MPLNKETEPNRTDSFRIWTRVTDSISYDDNRDAKSVAYVCVHTHERVLVINKNRIKW